MAITPEQIQAEATAKGINLDVAEGNLAMAEQKTPEIQLPEVMGNGTITSGDDGLGKSIQSGKDSQTYLSNIISQIPQLETPTIAPIDISGISTALNTPTNLGSDVALQESQKMIEGRQGVLGQRLETRKGEITKSAEEQKAELEVKNYQQKEFTRASLARIGISEQNSSQAVQYLNDLQLEQNKALVSLYNNTQTLLNQAEQAYQDADFELAGMWVDALKAAQTRQDDLMKFRVQTQIQLAELNLKQQSFAVQTGLDYANYSLNSIKTALDAIGEGNRSQEANAQIALDAIKEERARKEFEKELEKPLTQEIDGVLYQYDEDTDEWEQMTELIEKPEEKTAAIQEYEYYSKQTKEAGGTPISFSEYQTMDANRKKSIQNTYIEGGLTKEQFNRLNTIADNARQDQNIKDFPAIRASYETARSAAGTNDSAGDIVLMRMLAKITDPTTGVREEEYRTFQDAVGTLPRYGVQLTTGLIGKGKLTEGGRQILLKQIENIYNQRASAYQSSIDYFTNQAEKSGGSKEDILPVYLAPEEKKTNEPTQEDIDYVKTLNLK